MKSLGNLISHNLFMDELVPSIRNASLSDLESIKVLLETSLAEFGLFSNYTDADADLAAFEEIYLNGHGVFLVAEDESGVVGSVGLHSTSGDVAKLRKMYVAKRVRGHGLGRKLLDQILAEAKARQLRSILLETMDDMAAAIHLYESVGFVREDGHPLSPRCQRVYRLNL